MKPDLTNFNKAKYNDSTVANFLRMGGPLEELIGLMYLKQEGMMKRIMELELIAPKRWQLPDGRCVIWTCPDALIPITGVRAEDVSQSDSAIAADQTPREVTE